MRFLFVSSFVTVLIALTACGGSPAPTLATPARPPLAVPTSAPAATATVGLVTATPEPANAVPAATEAPQGVATAAAPAATDVPVAPVAPNSKLVGSYSGILPAADAAGRVVTLDLAIDGTATMTTQFIGKGDPIVEVGTWAADGDSAHVSFTQNNGQPQDNRITWTLQGTNLVTTEYDKTLYGTAGLPLSRVGTGEIITADYEGVSFSFDSALAKSAQGILLPAHPVEQAPALGGGAPQGIRFVFDNTTLPDFFDPNQPQVYVYPVDGLTALDPSVAKNVEALQQLLADGTVDAASEIPVFPLIPSSQLFHAQTHLVDFINGTGISFITYYAQDVSPLRPEQVFWSFQGITLDKKYYVSAFWHITSPALPEAKDITGAEYDAFAKQYTDYVQNIVTTLNGLPPAGFVPNLSLLENMARSINASPLMTEATPAAATPEPQATAASAQAQPTAPAEATVVPVGGQTLNAEFGGVSFSFNSAIAQSAQGVTLPAVAIDPNVPGGLSMGGPEHVAFSFNGAPITSDVSPFQPQVRVYPTDALQALDPNIAREILGLKTLLQVKPQTIAETVPVLPVFNAQQVLHPQLKYLSFKNGEGVRFVTFYAQDPSPVTNDGLFYTFQGLSSDGKHYITAFFPIRTDKLPNTYKDVEIKDSDAWMKQFDQYLQTTDAMLSTLPSDAYTPNLDTLDQIITSLKCRTSE